MSSSNEQRSHAEALFNVCKQSDPDPDALCLHLAHLLQVCAQPDTRAMAAILLRKLLTRDDSYIWPRLTHSSIKSVLLNQIQVETAQSLSQKLCDTVSELASSILPENGWPELLPSTSKNTMMELCLT
ncbi:Ipo5 [Gossypium arboreum]|uniref:Ipo5 n=1 Tax=Gossypium arboreum TaxID=29729 RepID=A0A0B0NZW0_GOSAR|nr:Ipo5 [Gossypium arboreum]